ncbi:hypothetical protein [Actinomyces trachealis]|uniref:hypothetical protein n=1 Tax=Actinomyces trachealis TaxID=2763540 RepID=UPI0018C66C19|nr:hypothetical protein [Actinomyces trachealis]
MSDRGPDLDATTITGLRGALSTRLAERGESAQLFVAGGAAIALAYDRTCLNEGPDDDAANR